jgi:hypothetical protein
MDAYYDQGLFTDGLITIQTDELHVYEDGLQVIPQDMNLSYGMPKIVERLMDASKHYERITGINKAGHRHFRSNFYSATKMAEEGVWGYQFPLSYCILHSDLTLVEYNGNPRAKKVLLEIADGLLAHRKKEENGRWTMPSIINFASDEARGPSSGVVTHLFWAAYRWTGDEKYLQPFLDSGPGSMGSVNANMMDLLDRRDTWGRQIAASTTPHSGGSFQRHLAWMVTGNKQYLEELYADQMQRNSQRMYLNTDGQWWIDRVNGAFPELERARLGGISEQRQTFYPGHVVSWRFAAPASGEDVAILIPKAKLDEFTVLVYNTKREPVNASMIAWDIAPGTWEATIGRDTNGDDQPDGATEKRTVSLAKTESMDLTFAPGTTTVIQMKLASKSTPYWDRPDLGISPEDVKASGNEITVTVHSLGSVDSPQTDIALLGADGSTLASGSVQALPAPVDLAPKTAQVKLSIPAGTSLSGSRVVLDPGKKLTEITRRNNEVVISR